MVNTRFWNDGWVRKLNPLDRYLFLYLLTNEHTNICGIYELSTATMAFETGLDERDIEKSMLARLSPKILHSCDYVICTNFIRHQNMNNVKIVAGIKAELKDIPKPVLDLAMIHGYPMDELSHLNTNLIKLNTNTNTLLHQQGFEDFWKEYPRKVNKKKARESWERVMRDEKTTSSQIMHALAAWKLSKQWRDAGGKYIPHPTTWLNGERWEDEVGSALAKTTSDAF